MIFMYNFVDAAVSDTQPVHSLSSETAVGHFEEGNRIFLTTEGKLLPYNITGFEMLAPSSLPETLIVNVRVNRHRPS